MAIDVFVYWTYCQQTLAELYMHIWSSRLHRPVEFHVTILIFDKIT